MIRVDNYPLKRYIFGVDDAAAATVAASAIGAGASAAGQASLNKKTREFNREEAEKQRLWSEKMYNEQNAWNYRMWQEQNAYNDPASQLQRLRDAGLNPLYFGLDGSSAGNIQAAQPLGYERAQIGNQVNPLGDMSDFAMKAAQITALELENAKKKKELGWADDEHDLDMQIKAANLEEIQTKVKEADTRIANGQMDLKLKEKGLDKADAEIAVEWAKYASLGLDNDHKAKINPLLERAQELQNQLLEVQSKHEEQRILAELAEVRAHTAALYAQAALAGAQKEGVRLENIIRKADARFASTNAQNRANLLKWTANTQREKLKQSQFGTANAEYYSEHYEEAFRNSWSQSGVEYGVTEHVGEALGTAAMIGLMLAF